MQYIERQRKMFVPQIYPNIIFVYFVVVIIIRLCAHYTYFSSSKFFWNALCFIFDEFKEFFFNFYTKHIVYFYVLFHIHDFK